MIIPLPPSTRSTERPQKSSMMRLKNRWTKPEWTRVAVSGVRITGTGQPGPGGDPTWAEVKPPASATASSQPRAQAISQAAAVTAAMARVTGAAGRSSGGRIRSPPWAVSAKA